MSVHTTPRGGVARRCHPLLILALIASLGVALPSATLGAEETPAPVSTMAPAPSLAPAEALCESAADLRLIIAFAQESDVSEDGWLPFLVAGIAGISEAQTLLGLVDETYRPLVEDLIVSLQDLGATAESLEDMETVGARVAAMGEAITDIGEAMDALSVQLQTRCPVDVPEDT